MDHGLLYAEVAGNLSTMQKRTMLDRVTLAEGRVRCT
jgi:hypothetical protein